MIFHTKAPSVSSVYFGNTLALLPVFTLIGISTPVRVPVLRPPPSRQLQLQLPILEPNPRPPFHAPIGLISLTSALSPAI